jgi:hypothetical protein
MKKKKKAATNLSCWNKLVFLDNYIIVGENDLSLQYFFVVANNANF